MYVHMCFTKYGTIDGEVLNLSKDAVPLEDVGYVYAARVSMAKSDMYVGNKLVNLTPGMNVFFMARKTIRWKLKPANAV